jgi:hypothetical protein
MPTPTIPAGNLFMNATLYTGTGASQAITNGVAGQAFQPDFVWAKSRSTGSGHVLSDSVRGAGKSLASQDTAAEVTDAQQLVSFNSNGFTMGTTGDVNFSGRTYVGWQWKAGGTAVSNTQGTINSLVSANTTSGFSVVTYTGTGSNGSVGHGLGPLGVDPLIIFVKRRDSTSNWSVYYNVNGFGAAVRYLELNTTIAGAFDTTYWNQVPATTTVFSLGTAGAVNTSSATYVAYCFAPVAGYSSIGTYTGNGSTDGPFVYTGFRPRWVMIKCLSSGGDWLVIDTSRDPANEAPSFLFPNLSSAEQSSSGGLDVLSNGFKVRRSFGNINTSGQTYIYATFAENPLKYANAR